jgi:hypothetical protein
LFSYSKRSSKKKVIGSQSGTSSKSDETTTKENPKNNKNEERRNYKNDNHSIHNHKHCIDRYPSIGLLDQRHIGNQNTISMVIQFI